MTYTYLKRSVPGYYLEMEEELDSKDFEIGTTWEDFLNHKYLLLSEEQLAYHDIYPDAKPKDVWEMTPPHVRTLEDAKKEMIAKINKYDKSNYVNGFYIGENLLWLTMSERANALLTLESAKALGVETVPYLGMVFPVEQGIQAIHYINLYAAQAAAVTEQHKTAVNAMERIIDVDAYDYTEGYPKQLHFNFE